MSMYVNYFDCSLFRRIIAIITFGSDVITSADCLKSYFVIRQLILANFFEICYFVSLLIILR